MKALPASNPLSWKFQVAMHNGPYPDGTSSDVCQHGNCFFLAWHRMYLFFFERILIKHMKTVWPKPGLPYWDNANTTPVKTKIPLLFRKRSTAGVISIPPSPVSSRLYHPRNPGYNKPNNNAWPVQAYIIMNYKNAVTNNIDYYNFQRALENAHGDIHIEMGSWTNPQNGLTNFYDMYNGAQAANDPIFFLHHANVDRYWEKWLKAGNGRNNPNASCDPFWWNKTFEFYDSTGEKVSLKGEDIVAINNAMMMNYQYCEWNSHTNTCNYLPTGPYAANEKTCKKEDKLTACPVKRKALPALVSKQTKIYGPWGSIRFNTDSSLIQQLKKLNLPAGDYEKMDVYIEFSDISSKNPPTGIEVYVNPAAGNPDMLMPQRTDYAGSIDLFTPNAVKAHHHMLHHAETPEPYIQQIKITQLLKEKNISLQQLFNTELVLLFRGNNSSVGKWLKTGDLLIGRAALAVYFKNP